jgi:acyl-coenzyme A synthetase/AMP-(fatty) acid ligase
MRCTSIPASSTRPWSAFRTARWAKNRTVVVLKDGASVSEAELRAFVAERLAAFKVPVKIAFAVDALPRNPTGKLIKRELKRLFV